MKNDVEEANANEGADPSSDLKAQNPGQTTTPDIVEKGMDKKRSDGKPDKVQKLAKAGRDDFDPNVESPD